MSKKLSASSARDKRLGKSATHIPDDQIDFTDIPESTDVELSRARRVGRPKSGNAKQLIAIRIDPALLAQLRKLAALRRQPYQTLLHEILEAGAAKRPHAVARQQVAFKARPDALHQLDQIVQELQRDPRKNLHDEVMRFELQLIMRAIETCGGNQARAAKLLRVNRTTLNAKIKRYGLVVDASADKARASERLSDEIAAA